MLKADAVDLLAVVALVDLIEHGEDRVLVGSDFAQHLHGRFEVFVRFGVGDVDDVYEKIGDDGFFEGGLEGIDEAMRELAHEADGVGGQHVLAVVEIESAGGGVERGEELVSREDFGLGQLVEQGGFSGVGVADDGYGGDGLAQSLGPLHVSVLDDFLEFLLHDGDAVANHAAVRFELCFALAAGAGAAAALAAQVSPCSAQAR